LMGDNMQVSTDQIIDEILVYVRDQTEDFCSTGEESSRLKALAGIDIISRIVSAFEKPDTDTQKHVRAKIRKRLQAIYGRAFINGGE